MIRFVVPPEVADLRERIGALQAEVAAQQLAPLSEKEVHARIDELIAAHAEHGQGRLILGHLIHPGAVPAISWPLDHAGARIEPSAFDLLCTLDPEYMRGRLRALAAQATRGPAADARAKRLSKLHSDLLALEREEEALITELWEAGTYVHRRHDANPATFFEV